VASANFCDHASLLMRTNNDVDDVVLEKPQLLCNQHCCMLSEVMMYVDGTILSVDSKSILKHSSTIEVASKSQVYKMRLIFELNIHSFEKLPLDMFPLDKLRGMRYKNIDPNAYVHADDQVHLGLFDDVGLLFDEGKDNWASWYGTLERCKK